MITPTEGRIVWFVPRSTNLREARQKGRLAAIVSWVHHDRLVNLCVFGPDGVPEPRTSVKLMQEGDAIPADSVEYCEWMPYQKGQAAKTEALENKISPPL